MSRTVGARLLAPLTAAGVAATLLVTLSVAPGLADPASAATTPAPVAHAVRTTHAARSTTSLPVGAHVRLVAKSWHRNLIGLVGTAPATVGKLLAAHGVHPDSNDRTWVGPASAADARAGIAATVRVQRVSVVHRTTRKHVHHRTVTVRSAARYRSLGSYVKRRGHDGTRTTVQRVATVDGAVVSRRTLRTHSTALSRVVVKGTRKAPKHATVGYSKAIAKDLVRRKGWSARQNRCLVTLWNRESGWRVSATNRSSGAAGIPQALPGRKMASAGSHWRTNPKTQITWGLRYVKGRYGTPCAALSHSNRHGWY